MDYSVLISVYHKENPEYFYLAIESMVNQSYLPKQIVIVKDGELGIDLENVIDIFVEKYPILFKIIHNEKNLGLGLSLQRGVLACDYPFIARMDSDDISRNDRCEKQIKCFERDKNLSIVGGNISEFEDQVENIIGYRNVPQSDIEIKDYLKTRCPFNHMTVMFKKEDVIKAGNYKHLLYNEDYLLWIDMMLSECKFQNLQDILVDVRVNTDLYQRRGGLTYFKSEKKIQDYLLSNEIISKLCYMMNITNRFLFQVVFPNKIRAYIFKKYIREKNKEKS